MAWQFNFQGIREDALAAANAFVPSTGAGHVDQWNRSKAVIITELQAMNPGQVIVRSSGKWDGTSKYPVSLVSISVQQAVIINGHPASPPNSSAGQ